MSKLTQSIAILGVVAGLGVSALPLSSYAETVTWTQEASDDTTQTNIGVDAEGDHFVSTDTAVTLTINDVLSIESDNQAVELKPQASATTVAGLYTGDNAVNLNVKSNNSKGYSLTILGTADTGTKNALTNDFGNEIVAGDLTSTSASEWGYYVGATVATGQTWKAVPADTAAEIGTKATATAETGDDYTVNFGANIIDGQAAGTYEGKVTFTATNLPNTTTPPSGD